APPRHHHDASTQLRDELLAEIGRLKDGEDLALWAYRRLSDKNRLTADDAGLVEAAYQAILDASQGGAVDEPPGPPPAINTPSHAQASKAIQTSAMANGSEVSPQKVSPRRNQIRRGKKPNFPCA